MKKFIVLIFVSLSLHVSAQENYWQQELNYKIDVELNDADKTLKGLETIVYKNNSPTRSILSGFISGLMLTATKTLLYFSS